MKRKRNHVLFGALSCIIAVSIYGYLNMADEFPAGWTDLTVILTHHISLPIL